MSTFCLADPPYVGEARRKYGSHPDYAGEVDHAELIDRMCSDFDGWALCLSAKSLRGILAMCPPDVIVLAWFKPAAAPPRPEPLPERRRAWLPTLWVIATCWHTTNAGLFHLDPAGIAYPFCFACGEMPPAPEHLPPERRWNAAAQWLDRAHLVDRAGGGLDGPQNIVPLCIACHRVMPSFKIEHGAEAIQWVLGGGRLAVLRGLPESRR